QHGEVFVTDDGGETDLDLGHYERFTSGRVTRDHNVTTGKVYFSVIQKERRGDYLGRTVQVIPHITDEIKASIRRIARDTDVVIVEVGGTVGDIEGLPFLEAIRQFKKDVGRENVLYVHLTLVPFMQAASELKTKATQHSVKELRAIGIQPDILLCRTDRYLPPGIKSKIALFCDVEKMGADAPFADVHGILVPGGFGDRGIEGKVQAVRYARERGVPYFGICLGMQCAVIEYARNVCGLAGANSTEFEPHPAHNLIDLLPEQRTIADKGGTMRLGLYPIVLGEGSLASRLYGQGIIQERHRHRYEVNNDYVHRLEKHGLRISGIWAEKQ